MKKLCLILALVLTLSFSSISITCLAQGGSVKINGASAKAGDEVTVEIVASGVKDVNSGSLEVKSLPKGVTVTDGEWTVDSPIKAYDTEKNRGVFALSEKGDLDGTIFKLKLKLSGGAESGDIVCELRFKNGGAGNPDVEGIEVYPGKLTVVSASAGGDDTAKDETPSDAPADDTPADDDTGDTQAPAPEKDDGGAKDDSAHGDGSGNADGGDKGKLSPIVIALIAVAGAALVAALVLLLTKKKK